MRLMGDRGGAGRLRRCWRPRRHDGPVRTLCRVERLTGAEHREREAMGPVRDGDGGAGKEAYLAGGFAGALPLFASRFAVGLMPVRRDRIRSS